MEFEKILLCQILNEEMDVNKHSKDKQLNFLKNVVCAQGLEEKAKRV